MFDYDNSIERPLDLNGLVRKPNPNRHSRIDFAVPGLLPKGHVTLIAGAPKGGKTWFIQKLTCDLSLGGEILGGFANIDCPQKVLFIEGDIGIDLLDYRFRLTGWEYNEQMVDIVANEDLRMKDIDLNLANQEGADFSQWFNFSNKA